MSKLAPRRSVEGGPRSAVMMDVAKLAGVSHQTVSRVMNEPDTVRPETRDRVLAAMRELDYQPNSAARTLVTRRSNTLGVVTVDSTLFGPSSMLYGIEQAARVAGYYVSIASMSVLDRSSVQHAVGRLREQAVEGIVAILPEDSAVAALDAVPRGIALVGVGGGSAANVPTVGVDNNAGAVAATRHLLELGHATVHHLAGPPTWPEARERQTGWRRTLRAAGAHIPESVPGDWSARSGYDAARALLADPSVTAVFCANDHMAMGLLRAMHEAGRRVPEDVSVVGFDDIPEAPFMIPPLTTVQQDFSEVGRLSVTLLLEIAGGRLLDDSVHLTPPLQLRESTAPPATLPGRGKGGSLR